MHKQDAEKKQLQIFSQMSPEERLIQAFKLRNLAWELKTAWFKSIHPEFSDLEIQKLTKDSFLYART